MMRFNSSIRSQYGRGILMKTKSRAPKKYSPLQDATTYPLNNQMIRKPVSNDQKSYVNVKEEVARRENKQKK